MLPSACGKQCQQYQQVSHLLRALQRPVIVPVVIIHSAAIRVCERGQQHQRALHLLRARRRHAIVPDAVTYGAAIGVRDQCQQHQPTLHLRRAIPCDEVTCHRARRGHLRCCRRRAR